MGTAIVLTALFSYLLGNLNGAILLSRLVEKDDVRRHGSGNAGFTNFFRNYGKATSLLVILIDGVKTALSCLLGGWLLGAMAWAPRGCSWGGSAPLWAMISPRCWAFGEARASSAALPPPWSPTGGSA